MSVRLGILSDSYSTMDRQRRILESLGFNDFKACLEEDYRSNYFSGIDVVWAHNVTGYYGTLICSDGRLPMTTCDEFELWKSRIQRALATGGNAPKKVVVLAASTGGPELIIRMMGKLPREMNAAIVVVIHHDFPLEKTLYRMLDKSSLWPVVKIDGVTSLESGHCYFVPMSSKISLSSRSVIQPSGKPWHGKFAPSIDHIVGTFAKAYRQQLLVAYLTGLKGEGVSSARIAQASGSKIVVQSAPTAAASGMVDDVVAAITKYDRVEAENINDYLLAWLSKE